MSPYKLLWIRVREDKWCKDLAELWDQNKLHLLNLTMLYFIQSSAMRHFKWSILKREETTWSILVFNMTFDFLSTLPGKRSKTFTNQTLKSRNSIKKDLRRFYLMRSDTMRNLHKGSKIEFLWWTRWMINGDFCELSSVKFENFNVIKRKR